MIMKLTKAEIEEKDFHIVNTGLQVLSPNHVNEWHTVTDESAVMVKERIYCTRQWYDNLMERVNK
jgi:hypothetical protein